MRDAFNIFVSICREVWLLQLDLDICFQLTTQTCYSCLFDVCDILGQESKASAEV